MHRALRLAFVLLVLAPGIVSAQFTPLSTSNAAATRPKCFMTTAPDPTGSKTFKLPADVTGIQAYMENAIMCPSACYDMLVTLTLKADLSMLVKVAATNRCAPGSATKENAQKANRGCGTGQTQPALKVTIIGTPGKQPDIKNRCDTTALAKIGSGLLAGGGTKDIALQSYASSAAANVDLTTREGQQQSSSVLQAFGVSQSEADALVRERPDEARALLQALASGDKEAVKDAAGTAGVQLNNDTLNNIASLSAEDRAKNFSDLYTDGQKQSIQNIIQADKTGFNAPENVQRTYNECGVAGLAGLFAKIESGCGRNTYSATTNVIGPYQFLCSTWQSYAMRTGNGQYAGCGYASDATVSTKIMNDAIEQIYRPKFGATIEQLGIKENAGLYMPHLLGENGAAKFFAAYQQNPNMSANELRAYLGDAAINNNRSLFYAGGAPRTLEGVLAEVDRRMTGTPYVGGLASGGSPFGTYGNYYGGSPVYAGYSPSAFANASPAGAYFRPTTVGSPVSSYTPSPTPIIQPSPVSQVISQPQPSSTTGASAANPVATLIVQPKSVFKGNAITISWSTVGMRTDAPCQLFAEQNFIAQGNEGTRSFDTKSVATSTVVNFSLQCLPLNGGSKIQQSASVLVK